MPDEIKTVVIIEMMYGWHDYFELLDRIFNPGKPPSAGRGFRLWLRLWLTRGRHLGIGHVCDGTNHFLAPLTTRKLRIHEAGHQPAFGKSFKPIEAAPVDIPGEIGGLPHEPVSTLDVMLPANHSYLRLTDRRGLKTQYAAWEKAGRVQRVRFPGWGAVDQRRTT